MCAQALKLFLDCCRQRAIQPLAAAAQGTLLQHDLQELLTKLAETVQVSCADCGHAFHVEFAVVCLAITHHWPELSAREVETVQVSVAD